MVTGGGGEGRRRRGGGEVVKRCGHGEEGAGGDKDEDGGKG